MTDPPRGASLAKARIRIMQQRSGIRPLLRGLGVREAPVRVRVTLWARPAWGTSPCPASFLLFVGADRAPALADSIRLSASRKSVRAHSNASALRSPPLAARPGLTLISPAWPTWTPLVRFDGCFFGLLWLVLMLCRSSRVFSLRVQVPLKRAFAGICQLFEVRPVLGAHDPWQRRIAQPFSQLNPLVQ